MCMWFKFARVFANRKRRILCQLIYVTNQDRKDAVYVNVIFTLMNFLVLVVPPDLGQNREVRDYGRNDGILWNVFLEATLAGT